MNNSLPTGTVTFLFTDIQGSTPLWEREPEKMAAALLIHNSALRQSIEANGGVIFKFIGDEYQAVFPTATQALAAAIEGQRALQAAPWNELGELRVRMGLHTGEAELDAGGDEYAVSHTKNRAGRIRSAAHGGQILLSEETADLVKRKLPEGVLLKDLGEHHLKGMEWLERLYQVCVPGLPQDFPPLATGITHPNNLPKQMTSFVGREKEIDVICSLLRTHRLVTLTGSGGTGKTRLSLQAAERVLEDYLNGAWLVELAPLADPELIPKTVASALHLPEIPGKLVLESLIDFLCAKHLLLILDNCEHLLEPCASLADKLLHACPELTILATSREFLGVAGEAPYRVPSMSMPDLRHMPSLEALAEFDAVILFLERAWVVSPDFAVTQTNAAFIAQVVNRLDGIPLAIELAAARLRLLSVEQIATRLDDAFHLLTGGSRTVLPRHQTLRALIDWSYTLLSSVERLALLRLSVFTGSFTLEASEAVCADDLPDEDRNFIETSIQKADVLDLVAELVDKSLVVPVIFRSGGNRYRILETIRQYAHEKLVDAGEAEKIRDRHLAYYVNLARQAEPPLHGFGQVSWLNLLEEELENLYLAVEWSLPRNVEAGLSLAADLLWFYHIHAHVPEWTAWLEKLINAESKQRGDQPPDRQRSLVLARAVAALGTLLGGWGYYSMTDDARLALQAENLRRMREMEDPPPRELGMALMGYISTNNTLSEEERLRFNEECLRLFKLAGDGSHTIDILQSMADTDYRSGNLSGYQEKIERCVAIAREIGNVERVGFDLELLANYWIRQGDLDKAETMLLESVKCYQQTKNDWRLAMVYVSLENIASKRGDFSLAANQNETASAFIYHEADKRSTARLLIIHAGEAWIHGDDVQAERLIGKLETLQEEDAHAMQFLNVKADYQCLIGRMAISRGDWTTARTQLEEALSYFHASGRNAIYVVLDILAVLACAQGQYNRAARLFGATALRYPMFEGWFSASENNRHSQGLIECREALGEVAFQKVYEEGKVMTPEQAVAYALEEHE